MAFSNLSDTPVLLFENEFKLHILGKAYDYPFPLVAGLGLVDCRNRACPSCWLWALAPGLPLSACLVMTAMIQLTIPTGWPIHATWAAMAAGVVLLGLGEVLAVTAFCAGPRGPDLTSRPALG